MENKKSKIYDMVVCALFAAICCVLSPISVPIGPVPVSLGLLAVIFTGVVLGPVRGVISVAVFFILGLFLPVFTGGHVGFSTFVGPTGGYAWSYIIVVFVVGLLTQIRFNNKIVEIIANVFFCIIGVVICYFFGTIQFMLVMNTNLSYSLGVCVVPFIPFDIVKCLIAGIAGPPIKSALSKVGYIKKKA